MPTSLLFHPPSCRTSPQPDDDDDCLFPEFPLFGDRRESDPSEWSSGSSPTDDSDEQDQRSSLGRRMSGRERQRTNVNATTLGKDGLHAPPHSPRSTSPPSPKAGSAAPLSSRFPHTFRQSTSSSSPSSATSSSSSSSSAPFPAAPARPGASAPGASARSIRPRGLTPLTPVAPAPSPGRHPGMPKSQPLARALFARMADAPHAGMGAEGKSQKGKGQKVIVPGKAFRTSFTMDMTASELARRA